MNVTRIPVITIGTPEELKISFDLQEQDAIAVARAISMREMLERFGTTHTMLHSTEDVRLILRALDGLIREIANRAQP